MVAVSPGQVVPARHHHRRADGHDKHDTAHGRGALLGHMPGGAVRPNGLPRLQPPEQRDEQLPRDGGHAKGHNKAENESHIQNPPGFFSFELL